MRHLHLFALLLLAAAIASLSAGDADAASCNTFASGSTAPTGYGAAWDVLSSGKELLLNSNCDNGSGQAVREVGVGYANHYIYKLGYRYNDGWQSFDLIGNAVSGSTDWLSGQASVTFGVSNFSDAPDPYYWVAYICRWTGTEWKCGCRDSACTTNYWQLQGFNNSSSGTGSGNVLKQQYQNLYNEDLPWMGLFYGLGFSGDQFLAAAIRKSGTQWAARFRAERSGALASVGWHNRWEWPGSADGYSSGTGGRIHAELRADDGSSNHLPGALLATSASYVPSEGGTNNFTDLALSQSVNLEAGKLYHLVFVQTESDYASINFSKTVNCTSPRGGPYFGRDATILLNDGSGWKTYGASAISKFSCAIPYAILRYSDGVRVSAGGGWGGNVYSQANVVVGGQTRVREKFTVSGPTRRVNGFWFRADRNGTAQITFELKNNSGSVLASASVPATTFDDGEFQKEGGAVNWKYVTLSQAVSLTGGGTYSLEIGSSGTSLKVTAQIDMVTHGEVPGDMHFWTDGVAEISENGGGSWQGFPQSTGGTRSYTSYGDLPILFTLEGGPNAINSVSSN